MGNHRLKPSPLIGDERIAYWFFVLGEETEAKLLKNQIMLNLKTPFILLYVFTLAISYLNAQAPNLIVEGWAKIDGERLEFTDAHQSNIFIGFDSGKKSNDFSFYNTSLGYQTLNEQIDGSYNTAIGYRALAEHIMQGGNTAIGAQALEKNTIGGGNTAIGSSALRYNSNGFGNTASGRNALHNNTEGHHNTANGTDALSHNTTGNDNTSTGYRALYNNVQGNVNIATGYRALYNNIQGNDNAAFGASALHENISGSGNTAIGINALFSNLTGTNNTAVGNHAFHNGQFYFNSTAIGNNTQISSANQIRFGNVSVTSIGGFEPWTNLSDKRLKKNIKKDIPGLAFITQLKPVSYQLDMDDIAKWQQTPDSLRDFKSEKIKGDIRYSGFLAQEVEATAKAIGYEFSGVDAPKNEGDRYGLRYSQFVVPLVQAVQELNEEKEDAAKKIEKLEGEIDALKALLGKQQHQQTVELRTTGKAATQTPTLGQNYPNPFNGKTNIDCFIPEGVQQAMLRITDNTGKLIQDIKIHSSGIGQIEVDATELKQSNYFYSLILDGHLVESKQLILIK